MPRRGLAGRTRRERCRLPSQGDCPLRAPRHHGRAGLDRQRRLLREPHLHLHGGGKEPAIEAHAALPASDQWQGGGVQQDHAGRVGVSATVLLLLAVLRELAKREGRPFNAVLEDAMRDYIAARRARPVTSMRGGRPTPRRGCRRG